MNNGRAGHAGRHHTLLETFVRALRSVWGALLEMEPTDYLPYMYSTYRPDVSVAPHSWKGGKRLCGDLKLLDPLTSNPSKVNARGSHVAMGNTLPGIEAQVSKDYAHALAGGKCDVRCLLFETFGGFSPAVRRLLAIAADKVKNKLSHAQHLDQATWATRTWTSLACQRISIALHTACAQEIVQELSAAAAGAGA